MFKLYTQPAFERGDTDGFGGFRPKNALLCSKKSFSTEDSVAETGAKWSWTFRAKGRRAVVKTALVEAVSGWRSAVKVGYKVGYKVFTVVVCQALMCGNQLSSTQPAAALGMRQARVQRVSLVVPQAAFCGVGRRGSDRVASAQADEPRPQLWGFGRAGGKGARQAFGALGACSRRCNRGLSDCVGRRFGRRRAFPARAVAPRPSFLAGGRGFAKHASPSQTDAFGRREIFADFGIWKRKPEVRQWRKTLWKTSAKTKRRPPLKKIARF